MSTRDMDRLIGFTHDEVVDRDEEDALDEELARDPGMGQRYVDKAGQMIEGTGHSQRHSEMEPGDICECGTRYLPDGTYEQVEIKDADEALSFTLTEEDVRYGIEHGLTGEQIAARAIERQYPGSKVTFMTERIPVGEVPHGDAIN